MGVSTVTLVLDIEQAREILALINHHGNGSLDSVADTIESRLHPPALEYEEEYDYYARRCETLNRPQLPYEEWVKLLG